MKQILTILIVLLFSASVVSAQDIPTTTTTIRSGDSDRSGSDSGEGGDDDERRPLQIGYAVITPLSVTTSGLVVFETFGLKWGFDFLHAGVLPPDLTTNGLLFVDANGRLSRNLG